MGNVIVIEFITLDGIVTDPDGSGGTPNGGWAFRYGPEAVAGDKFLLGPVLDHGVMLLGRVTWEMFSKLWPGRTDEFSAKLNAMSKLVASSTLSDVSAWNNSALVEGDLIDAVRNEQRDIVVTGSSSVVDALQEHDLVDEYRLITFPVTIGTGRRLFSRPVELKTVSAEQVGAAVRTRYERVR